MNSILMIMPRRESGIWVFDDEAVGLSREPFVGDANVLMDRLTAGLDIRKGVNVLFSTGPFPTASIQLKLQASDFTGSTYWTAAHRDLAVWLCPALFKYFPSAPQELWVGVEEIRKKESVEAPEEKLLRIFYRCPKCGERWDDTWSSMVDSDCPQDDCDTKDVEALFCLDATDPEAELRDATNQLYAKWDETHPIK